MKRVALALVVCAALAPRSSVASCVEPPPLEQSLGEARTAFVGTVTQTSNRDRDAVVAVESIWLGEVLPPTVVVHGGQTSPDVVSSIDREYLEGRRYLFVLDDPEPPFRDDSCTATTLYTDEVAALEPEGAVEPQEPRQLGPWLLVGFGLVAIAVLQARRARRRAHSVNV